MNANNVTATEIWTRTCEILFDGFTRQKYHHISLYCFKFCHKIGYDIHVRIPTSTRSTYLKQTYEAEALNLQELVQRGGML